MAQIKGMPWAPSAAHVDKGASFHVWEGGEKQEERGRKSEEGRRGEGETGGRSRGGEKLDADSPAATFFFFFSPSLLVHSGRSPKKIQDKEGGK